MFGRAWSVAAVVGTSASMSISIGIGIGIEIGINEQIGVLFICLAS